MKGKPDNLVGQTFNFLTVIEKDKDYKKRNNLNPNSGAYWRCKCICGNEVSVRGSALKSNQIQSCGCKRKELTRKKQMTDISNQKFGHLLVLKPVYDYAEQRGIKNSGHVIYWECLCDCGNICVEPGTELRSGKVRSCSQCAFISKGEDKIKELLNKNNIKYIYNDNYFKDLKNPQNNDYLRYDFIIIDENKNPLYLIEYDGEQHFKPIKRWGGEERLKKQQEYDNIKNNYAINHNLPLIRIPYTHYKNLIIKDLLLETSNYII